MAVADVQVGDVERAPVFHCHGRAAAPSEQELVGGDRVPAHVERRAVLHVEVVAAGEAHVGAQVQRAAREDVDAPCGVPCRRGRDGRAAADLEVGRDVAGPEIQGAAALDIQVLGVERAAALIHDARAATLADHEIAADRERIAPEVEGPGGPAAVAQIDVGGRLAGRQGDGRRRGGPAGIRAADVDGVRCPRHRAGCPGRGVLPGAVARGAGLTESGARGAADQHNGK